MAMDMDMSGSGNAMDSNSTACKASMFWNWYTINACFLSSSWQISSHASFFGACIAVIGLVVLLEFLRRLQRDYDRFLFIQWTTAQSTSADDKDNDDDSSSNNHHSSNRDAEATKERCSSKHDPDAPLNSAVPLLLAGDWPTALSASPASSPTTAIAAAAATLKPTWLQQAIRAALYTAQFVVAYLIMLLAMYYNGYILLSIFAGVFLGFCLFSRDTFGTGGVAAVQGPAENAACCA